VIIEPRKSWAESRFGSDAPGLRQAVVDGLKEAYVGSRDAQDISGAEALDPFGHTLKTLQFQKLAERIANLLPERHRIVKLDRYSLAVVNNFVLYPARNADPHATHAEYGRVRRPVSKFRRRIFSALGPEPYQLPLAADLEPEEPSAEDLRTLLARLGKDTRLVAISYICGYSTGILDACWGEAELNMHDGSLIFHDGEKLTITPAVTGARRPPWSAGNASTSRSFDGGEPPKVDMMPNPAHQNPAAEAEPAQPLSSDEAG
jgi:hypothetical protein